MNVLISAKFLSPKHVVELSIVHVWVKVTTVYISIASHFCMHLSAMIPFWFCYMFLCLFSLFLPLPFSILFLLQDTCEAGIVAGFSCGSTPASTQLINLTTEDLFFTPLFCWIIQFCSASCVPCCFGSLCVFRVRVFNELSLHVLSGNPSSPHQ